MIYLDSSGALAYRLAEDRYPTNALWDQPIVSSRLFECEVWNRINTRGLADSHGDLVRSLIGRIAMIEMVPPVLKRALELFPAPVRTLDALHLAAIEFHPLPRCKCTASVPLLTGDSQIGANLQVCADEENRAD